MRACGHSAQPEFAAPTEHLNPAHRGAAFIHAANPHPCRPPHERASRHAGEATGDPPSTAKQPTSDSGQLPGRLPSSALLS